MSQNLLRDPASIRHPLRSVFSFQRFPLHALGPSLPAHVAHRYSRAFHESCESLLFCLSKSRLVPVTTGTSKRTTATMIMFKISIASTMIFTR